jgi:hypothetical protein
MAQPTTKNGPSGLPPHIYTFLTNYYLHQDQLSWRRTQLLVAVEGATLAAAFANPQLAELTLLLGIVLVLVIWRLVERDWEVRDQNLHLLDADHQPLAVRMVKEPRSRWWKGSFLLRIAFVLLIAVDLLLIAKFLLARFI